MKLKIACLQLNPTISQVEQNVAKVRTILARVSGALDIVVLPELAVTGYNFGSRQAIEPFLESGDSGRSVALASEIALQHNCFAVIGYPELHRSAIYNSAVVVGPHGKVVHRYRKTFLYEADERWGCSENPARDFAAFDLVINKDHYTAGSASSPLASVRVNLGICMDLNPYKFEAPFNAFEFSLRSFEQGARLILCPMAWLSPHSPSIDSHHQWTPDQKVRQGQGFADRYFGASAPLEINTANTANLPGSSESFVPAAPCASTVDYWILRFFPFLSHPHSLPKNFRRVTVATSNRSGVEDDVVYGGSSSIFQFDGTVPASREIDRANPSVSVLGSLGQGSEGILVREVDIDVEYH